RHPRAHDPAGDVNLVTLGAALGGRIERTWPLTGGVSAEVDAIVLVADGHRETLVVRRHRHADWKPVTDTVTATEFALLRGLHDAGLPVPAPRWLDAEATVLPTPGYVMAFVEGQTTVPDGPPDDVLDQMATFLTDLHTRRLDGLPGLESRVDPVPELLEWLAPSETALRAALSRLGPPASPDAVLHGDFWSGNVLWRDGRLVAVLDWEDAARGDPLSDLAGARIELLWRHGAPAMERFTTRYLRLHRLDVARLPLWELYVGVSAAATMEHWGLDPEVEREMRRRTDGFVATAQAATISLAAAGRSGS
ncbi:MAG: phosphotransferase, partial [Myxococcota bacterium]